VRRASRWTVPAGESPEHPDGAFRSCHPHLDNADQTSFPHNVDPGNTYTIQGTQFNGLSEGAYYGDDAAFSTNYPLVRITNHATGHVFYCRTHGHSTMAVATGPDIASTNFDQLALPIQLMPAENRSDPARRCTLFFPERYLLANTCGFLAMSGYTILGCSNRSVSPGLACSSYHL